MAKSSDRVSVVSPPVPVFLSAAEKQQEQAWSQLVINYYAERLREHEKAREYLRTQGLQDFALLSQLKVGFCDRTLHHLLPADARGGEQIRGALQRVGLLRPSGHAVHWSSRFTMHRGSWWVLTAAELPPDWWPAVTITCIGI